MKKMIAFIFLSLILGGVVGYYFGKTNSVGRDNIVRKEPIPQQTTVEQSIADFYSHPIIGRIAVKLDPKYGNTIIDAEPIWSLPEPPDKEFPSGNMNSIRPFDVNEGLGGLPLYSQMDDPTQPPNWKVSEIDIDNDGKPEKIMINSITMTSQPHLVRIVKNNKIIFEFSGSVLGIENVHGNHPRERGFYKPGFILTTQVWQDQNGQRVRYVVNEDGSIEPLWQQRHAGIEFPGLQ